ncbi:MAG: recombination mediator RecR [Phycisphaerales bacterium]
MSDDSAVGGSNSGGSGADGGREVRRVAAYPRAVERLIVEFAKLPGIGRRSAERLAFHVLRSAGEDILPLAASLREVKETIGHCPECWNLSGAGRCEVCEDPARDRTTVLVVEQPKDVIALEQTGMYRGMYHVLMGRLSPLEGIGPDELTIDALLARVDRHAASTHAKIEEVILGLNPTIEGDGTALHVAAELKGRGVRVTRLARGLPAGSQLEYANKAVLADAILCRQSV